MKARHQDIKDGTVNTHLGEVTLKNFRVTKITPQSEEKEVSHEDLVREIPGFLDEELFPVPVQGKADPRVYTEHGEFENQGAYEEFLKSKDKEKKEPKEMEDEEFKQLLIILHGNSKNLNSKGAVDIDVLNKKLREAGYKTSNATRRDAMWKKVEEEEKEAQSKGSGEEGKVQGAAEGNAHEG